MPCNPTLPTPRIEKQGNPSVSTEQRRRHYGLHPPKGGGPQEGEAGTHLYGCVIKPDCDMDNPLVQKK
ncbi:uncharacterized protein TNCV_2292611 [Trichonephila clavipes]|nr:uncharacterized protein TNCV_2292611 [Trichonephila clavipes]